MGFSYDIQYKSGKENIAVDALSRVDGAIILCLAVSIIDSDLLGQIKNSYHLDTNLISIIEELQDQQTFASYTLQGGILRKKGRMVIGPMHPLKHKLLCWHHSSPESGHGGRELTLK